VKSTAQPCGDPSDQDMDSGTLGGPKSLRAAEDILVAVEVLNEEMVPSARLQGSTAAIRTAQSKKLIDPTILEIHIGVADIS